MSTLDVTSGPRTDSVIRRLQNGDPAIRWQVLRDLVGAAEPTFERERRKVARHAWGARLLARRDPQGTFSELLRLRGLRREPNIPEGVPESFAEGSGGQLLRLSRGGLGSRRKAASGRLRVEGVPLVIKLLQACTRGVEPADGFRL
jgi:hypothetical protein